MTQSEFIEQVAAAAGTTQAETGRVLEAMIATVSAALVKGGDVRLAGLGVFDVGDRAAREGRNPSTGEAIKIPASKAVRFRAAKGLKDAVNGEAPKKAKK
ncbi:MAG: HU family DNA-binding protein [Pseudomonadota bacterium]|uniref:HU family DNA-binding protein n=1 Tax=Phenylobacterium sp. TaxID=1871053 RepID=UPI003364688A